ncbi:hypothetical protein BDR26DRAFT_853396 [Obelidium mucronatum]|nr:hypothetical protein BDR26DRAFT_853396 [Obelidium mucronatum]
MSINPRLTELIQQSSISASSTSQAGNCAGDRCQPANIKQNASTDMYNDLTVWQSTLDPSCNNQCFTVLFGPLGSNVDGGSENVSHNLTLVHSKNGIQDLSGKDLLECTSTNVKVTNKMVRYDLCSFSKTGAAAMNTFNSITAANFSWKPDRPSGNSGDSCQMNIYQLALFGESASALPTRIGNPGEGIPGIEFHGLFGVWITRQRNLRIRRLAKKLFEDRRFHGRETSRERETPGHRY